MVAVLPPPLSPVNDHSTETNDVAPEVEMPLPANPQTFFLGGLFGFSVLAAFYVASSIVFPVVLAFVLNLILQPAVRLLERIYVPRAIGALFAILLVIGALVGLGAALAVPAASWANRLPEGIPRLEAHLVFLKEPLQALQSVVQRAEQATADPTQKGSSVSVRRDLGLTAIFFAGARSVIDGLFTTVLMLYFLLIAGDILLRRIVEILPRFSDKRQASTYPSRFGKTYRSIL